MSVKAVAQERPTGTLGGSVGILAGGLIQVAKLDSAHAALVTAGVGVLTLAFSALTSAGGLKGLWHTLWQGKAA